MKRCKHYWCYEQAVYSTDEPIRQPSKITLDSTVRVHRWCATCMLRQWGFVTSWKTMPASDAAIREAEAKNREE